jgi:hypothetical protein
VISRAFGRVVRSPQFQRVVDPLPFRILHSVREFVRQQSQPDRSVGRVLPVCKHNVAPHRVGQRIHGTR